MEVGLAVSLHAPDNTLRSHIVPINRRYPIERLLEACRRYIERTGRRVTFEYIPMDGVNDSDDHARRTAELLRGLLCHVNLIPLNPSATCPYRPSSRERTLRFQEILVDGHIQTTLRASRGLEIEAGCGQLRERYAKRSAEAACHAAGADRAVDSGGNFARLGEQVRGRGRRRRHDPRGRDGWPLCAQHQRKPPVVAALRRVTSLPLDVHLMIVERRYVEACCGRRQLHHRARRSLPAPDRVRRSAGGAHPG